MIALFDSNIWISAFLADGTPLRAITHAVDMSGLVLSDTIEAEISRVMSEKFGWTEDRIRDALSIYLSYAIWVSVEGAVTGVCRDPKDDMVLESALGGGDLIVTGDKDLLALGSFRGCRIITLREFAEFAKL